MPSPRKSIGLPNGKIVATFSHPVVASLPDSSTRDSSLQSQGIQVYSTRLSSNNKLIAAGFGDGSLRIYSLADKRRLTTLGTECRLESGFCSESQTDPRLPADNLKPVTAVRWRKDDILLAVDAAGCVLVWANGRIVEKRQEKTFESFLTCDWSSSGASFCAAGAARDILVFDANRVSVVNTLSGHTNRVTALAHHPSNPNLLLSASWDQSLILWDIRSHHRVRSTSQVRVAGDSLAFLNEGSSVITGDGKEVTFRNFVSLEEDKVVQLPGRIHTLTSCKSGFVYGGDINGQGVLGAFDNCGKIRMKPISESQGGFTGHVWSADASEDIVLAGSSSGQVIVYQLNP